MSVFGAVSSRDMPCPCGGGEAYGECCGRLHSGAASASTARELMRSRYAAVAVGDADYLLRTWHPETRPSQLHLDPQHPWLGLEVLSSAAGGPDDAEGEVTYRAISRSPDGGETAFTERARFARHGRRWVYVDGDVTDG